MFCHNCGKEALGDSVFCPECGMRISVEPFGGMQESVGQGQAAAAGSASVMKKKGNIYMKITGIASGIMAFISLFPAHLKISGRALEFFEGIGNDLSGKATKFNFFDVAQNSEWGMFFIGLAILSIILLIFFQLVNRPWISLIGCVGMTIAVLFDVVQKSSANSYAYVSVYTYGAGFVLFNLASIAAYVAAIWGKRKKVKTDGI